MNPLLDEVIAQEKAAYEKMGAQQANCGQVADLRNTRETQSTPRQNHCRRPSLREEAEKNVGYHREQAEKHDQAAAFFRENPAFDEFIRLIRSGAIQV
jgi:hypothetical protein